jgi:hypothetical protein
MEDTHRDLHLRDITTHTMLDLGEQLSQHFAWVAAAHTDHIEKRHVNAIAVLTRRLNREQLISITQSATENALWQRKVQDLFLAANKRKGAKK